VLTGRGALPPMVSGWALFPSPANLTRMTRPNKSVDAGVLSSDLTGMMMAAADSQPENSAIDGLSLQYDEVQESH
jgi:hypothetical protein